MNNFTADSTQIDDDGITALRSFFSPSLCLVQKFETGGSCPIFDGDIWVYEQEQKNKNTSFINKIPVQIKSTNRMWNKKETFSIRKTELQNYKKVGGMFFLRPIFNSVIDYKIYVKLLLPVDITEILLKAKEGTKSVSVELDYCETIEALEVLVHHFLENQKHQIDFNWNEPENISISEGECIVLKTMGKKNDRKMIFNSYVYIQDKRKHQHPTLGRLSSLENEYNSTVLIGEQVFFKSYKIRHQKGNDILVLNSALEIELNKEKTKTSITADETTRFADLLDAMKFMQAVASKGEFHTADGAIEASIGGDFGNEEFLNSLIDTDCLLDKYTIDKNNLKMSDIEKHNQLITILTQEKAVLKSHEKDRCLKVRTFFNRKILLVFDRINGQNYSCSDFMFLEDAFGIEKCGAKYKINRCISLITTLPHGELAKFIEILEGYEDIIISDVKEKYTTDLFDEYNNLALECIRGYDILGKSSILQIAKELFSFMQDTETEPQRTAIITINNYQVLYRINSLSHDDHKHIHEQKKASSNILEICCLNILLDNFIEFEDGFKDLSEEDQEKFKVWPIWKLYENYLNAG